MGERENILSWRVGKPFCFDLASWPIRTKLDHCLNQSKNSIPIIRSRFYSADKRLNLIGLFRPFLLGHHHRNASPSITIQAKTACIHLKLRAPPLRCRTGAINGQKRQAQGQAQKRYHGATRKRRPRPPLPVQHGHRAGRTLQEAAMSAYPRAYIPHEPSDHPASGTKGGRAMGPSLARPSQPVGLPTKVNNLLDHLTAVVARGYIYYLP